MKIHHLNCGTMCPLGGRLLLGDQPRLVCHCLLIETASGLVLVDTGIGLQDVVRPNRRLGWMFQGIVRPRLDAGETALRQVQRLGFQETDVRDIIVTHLDPDHAGGLSDFPHANVHLFSPELDAAQNPADRMERTRYRAEQWAHKPGFVRQYINGEPWFGFDCVRKPHGLPPDILLVPLLGHSRGHAGVAVHTKTGWLLHAGDAYIHAGELDHEKPGCPPGMLLHQRATSVNLRLCRKNVERLRELAHEHSREVRVFSAHDPSELARLREGRQ
ncbi:MAG: MBL fold metallo-hydrolase [Deltaproteobacteria bacterium]|nr:MBL fold metallo-hydrolase [Deltaproteobacteria bacterium]